MIHSMTGYGKSIMPYFNKQFIWEIRSLNSKNFDLSLRIPPYYREKEMEFRKTIADLLQRGKVEAHFSIELTAKESSNQINSSIVQSYMRQLQEISNISEEQAIGIAMRLPDAVSSSKEEVDPEEFKHVLAALTTTLAKLQDFRIQEGEALECDLINRIHSIRAWLQKIAETNPQRVQSLRQRLEEATTDLRSQVDGNRLEQELIFYLEKLDITEEQVRLANHLDYFLHTMNTDFPNGRKLNFISQEIGREINTLGSKANHSSIQRMVVEMKDELEKVKEQLLNLL